MGFVPKWSTISGRAGGGLGRSGLLQPQLKLGICFALRLTLSLVESKQMEQVALLFIAAFYPVSLCWHWNIRQPQASYDIILPNRRIRILNPAWYLVRYLLNLRVMEGSFTVLEEGHRLMAVCLHPRGHLSVIRDNWFGSW